MKKLILLSAATSVLAGCNDSTDGTSTMSQSDFVSEYQGQYVGSQLVDQEPVHLGLTVNEGAFYLTVTEADESSTVYTGDYDEQTTSLSFNQGNIQCQLGDVYRCESNEDSFELRMHSPSDWIAIENVSGTYSNSTGGTLTIVQSGEQVYFELPDCMQSGQKMGPNEIKFDAGSCFNQDEMAMIEPETLEANGDTLKVTSANPLLAGYWFQG
ncbi:MULTISPECIES: hypothetical protein [unclassified Endozoicomonas]|uniref:hypothetical protein n=1 Tax=unclassified Endozoicomonas TaxID=2644528 RepID=UPI003BB65624